MKGEPTQDLLPESWSVRLPVFEGPLDLLLHLIRVNEVDITDIPVATICDQFHAYLQLMEELNLDVAAEYVYEAALLIYLKSRMLLPRSADGEPGAEADPRQELVARLLEYRRLKEAAQSLAEVHRVRQGMWTRGPAAAERSGAQDELDLGDVSLFDLLGAFQRVLARYRREHPEPMVVPGEAFSVRDQIERYLALLEVGRSLDLVEDLRRRSGRAEAVAAFLAVLELVRLCLVGLEAGAAGRILLARTGRAALPEELEAIG